MGIQGLWRILVPIQEEKSFLDLTMVEGFQQDPQGTHTLIIGVDISIWLASCQAILEGHDGMGENPVLCALFFKLCCYLCYLKTPVTFVFVFDGPCRPEVKCGRRMQRQDPKIIEASKQLIDMFGFYCHQAPAKAEVQLLELNQLGLIDGILTKDSDAFVFGAECIIPESVFSVQQDTIYPSCAELLTYILQDE
ncbi:PIN domain-like protein [Tricholoma matsutake]|nr:PIN domain-like protein [Tricholoma matsutake 945]